MHETYLIAQLLDLVQSEATINELVQVEKLRLRVGAGHMVVPELMQTAFEVMSERTVAAGAVLEIETVPLIAMCPTCDLEVKIIDWVFFCPTCGSILTEIISGKELDFVELIGNSQKK